MTIKELIELLEQKDPNRHIIVWDSKNDVPTTEVWITDTDNGVLITNK